MLTDVVFAHGSCISLENFGDCAEKCVLDTPESLTFSDAFRGFDFDCPSNSCYCLYDQGTLDKTNDGVFDSTAYGDALSSALLDEFSGGKGEILSVDYKVGYFGYYCGKRTQRAEDSDEPTYSPTLYEQDDDDDNEDIRHREL